MEQLIKEFIAHGVHSYGSEGLCFIVSVLFVSMLDLFVKCNHINLTYQVTHVSLSAQNTPCNYHVFFINVW
jgi:hypothetical protein